MEKTDNPKIKEKARGDCRGLPRDSHLPTGGDRGLWPRISCGETQDSQQSLQRGKQNSCFEADGPNRSALWGCLLPRWSETWGIFNSIKYSASCVGTIVQRAERMLALHVKNIKHLNTCMHLIQGTLCGPWSTAGSDP